MSQHPGGPTPPTWQGASRPLPGENTWNQLCWTLPHLGAGNIGRSLPHSLYKKKVMNIYIVPFRCQKQRLHCQNCHVRSDHPCPNAVHMDPSVRLPSHCWEALLVPCRLVFQFGDGGSLRNAVLWEHQRTNAPTHTHTHWVDGLPTVQSLWAKPVLSRLRAHRPAPPPPHPVPLGTATQHTHNTLRRNTHNTLRRNTH